MFKIIADSSADLVEVPHRVLSVPLKIMTDEREFVDDSSLDVKEMTDYLASYKGRSTTACPGTGDWLDAFGESENIFAVTVTSGLSGSYNSANTAKNEYEEKHPGRKVHIIDSLSAGPELKLICEKLEEYIKENLSFEKIREKIEEYKKKTGLIFSLESLKNFANNGRVSKVTAKLAGVLGIKIVGKASDEGTLEPLSKIKGEKKSLREILKLMCENGYSGGKVRIDHCENEISAKSLKELIFQAFPKADVIIEKTYGLCSFYAEIGGVLVGYEK